MFPDANAPMQRPEDATIGWPVAIVPLGPLAVGAVLWRWRGTLRATAIAKACFAFAPGAAMPLVDPVPLQREEAYDDGDPRLGAIVPSDLEPHRGQADVLFTGDAFSPGGAPVTTLTVRFGLSRADFTPIFDKAIEVHGERSQRPGQAPTDAAPFARMPIRYALAYGGIGWDPNPLGTGIAPGPNGATPLPNLVHPGGAPGLTAPAGFGALPYAWPSRRRLLRGLSRKALTARVAELPDAFEWAYAQAAPADQRVPFLAGDEWVRLSGLHPVHPDLAMQLPGVRAIARIYGPGDGERPLELAADTLLVDGARQRCTVTWRGRFAISSEAALASVTVAVGLERKGQAPAWPLRADMDELRLRVTTGFTAPRARDFEPTLPLDQPPVRAAAEATAELAPGGLGDRTVAFPPGFEPDGS
jgi:hypothetical protein